MRTRVIIACWISIVLRQFHSFYHSIQRDVKWFMFSERVVDIEWYWFDLMNKVDEVILCWIAWQLSKHQIRKDTGLSLFLSAYVLVLCSEVVKYLLWANGSKMSVTWLEITLLIIVTISVVLYTKAPTET